MKYLLKDLKALRKKSSIICISVESSFHEGKGRINLVTFHRNLRGKDIYNVYRIKHLENVVRILREAGIKPIPFGFFGKDPSILLQYHPESKSEVWSRILGGLIYMLILVQFFSVLLYVGN